MTLEQRNSRIAALEQEIEHLKNTTVTTPGWWIVRIENQRAILLEFLGETISDIFHVTGHPWFIIWVEDGNPGDSVDVVIRGNPGDSVDAVVIR